MFRSINFRHAKQPDPPSRSSRPLFLDQDAKLTEFSKLDNYGRLGFSWSGAHPLAPHAVSFVQVESRNSGINNTHLFYVSVLRDDRAIRLYDRQADMDIIGYSAHDAAAIVGAGLVRFLLNTRHPGKVAGLISQVAKGETSPWSKAFRDLRLGLIKQQLDRYQIPIAAYKENPDQYNVIKNPPPSND